MTRYQNPLDVPIDLDNWRIILPGQTVELPDTPAPHDQAHIDTGRLIPITMPEPTLAKKTRTKEHADA